MATHAWGISKNLHVDDMTRVDLIRGRAGGRSSNHIHEYLDNSLLVVNGEVVIYSGDLGDESEKIRLSDGESYTTKSNCPHRIEFLEDSIAVEIYRSDHSLGRTAMLSDIIRFDEGTM